MSYKVIGKDTTRFGAIAKVKGTALYAADMPKKKMLHGKIVRASIAHGIAKEIDISEALKVPGVVKILLPEDMPKSKFSTAGHPYVLNEAQRDIEDRNILTRRIRQYGDEIAAVVAETELAAIQAVEKIKVVYEEWPFYLKPEEALAQGAKPIHDERPNNIIADTTATVGDVEQGFAEADIVLEDEYSTQIVQHAHMENQIAYAYQDADERWVCVSSTQIPHIVRRVLGQALEMPWGKFRVIKPFIGGGFGNKQDVSIEPLVVAMSMACGGKAVMIDLTREESLAYTRVRHAISYKMKVGIKKDGSITALECHCLSNNGAYASHGHAIAAKGGGFMLGLYKIPNFLYHATTAYTNTAPGGAMRGYGIPQEVFAMESLIEKIARKLDRDPVEYRLQNVTEPGAFNPLNHIVQHSNRIADCLTEGRKCFGWDEKKAAADKTHDDSEFRRGVGVSALSYGTGVYPKGEEISGCRLMLNQDGSIKIIVGGTDMGQGSDTVFKQMVAESVGVSPEVVYPEYNTDTDTTPYDPGTFASRLSYTGGWAVREASEELRQKILEAAQKFESVATDRLEIVDSVVRIKDTEEPVIGLAELAMKTFYDWQMAECITAEKSVNIHTNSYSMGSCFAEVEVDMKTGKVYLLNLLNVHDSGRILNHKLAEGQVHGGQMMAVGYGLAEELRYDEKTGKPLNNNLLDYKFPTIMDLCELDAAFVEEDDPYGPYGNKALGEPPACSPAAAIRNAVLDALGVEFNHLPLTPQKIFEGAIYKVKEAQANV